MKLFMVELAVRELAVSIAWYQKVLGFTLEKLDAVNQFAMLTVPGGGRIALKQTEPIVSNVLVHFEVPDLQATYTHLTESGVEPSKEMKTSEEGYREIIITDPDGHHISLFEWVH